MPEKAINKVVYGTETLIDLTDSTVDAEHLISGYTAYNAAGVKISGTAPVISGTSTITSNGTHDVYNYQYASVNVVPPLQSKTVTPLESVQIISADSSYYGLSTVSVGAISSTYVGSGIPQNSASDVTVSGDSITTPSGYYSSSVTKSVATGTAGTPVANKGTVSNHTISVIPTVTNTTGYITGGTKTGTAVTISASELVSGSSTITSNNTYDVTNLSSVLVSINTVNNQNKTADPSLTEQEIIPDEGYTGLGKVTISAMPLGDAFTPATTITTQPSISINSTTGVITATNTSTSSVTPTVSSGYVSVGTAGTITVGGSNTLNLSIQSAKTITPTESIQRAVSAGYYVTGHISVAAISSTYVGSGIPTNSAADLIAGGSTVTVPNGFYSSDVSKNISAGNAFTPATTITISPSISINTGTGVITATNNGSSSITPTVNAGYISTGTAGTVSVEGSGTLALTTKATTTITPTESVQTAVNKNVYTTGSITVAAISSTYVGTGVTQNSAADLSVSNSTITVPSGYYSSNVATSITGGNAFTPAVTITTNPTISLNTSTGLVTASYSGSSAITPTVNAGYISQGTAGTISTAGNITYQLTSLPSQTITPGTTNQTISSGVYLVGDQTILGDANLLSSNIRSGVSIFGVVGTNEGGATFIEDRADSHGGTIRIINTNKMVSGISTITSNGLFSISSYFSVSVNVVPSLENKTVTPTESQQIISADTGYEGLSTVTVDGISSTYVGTGVPTNSAADLTQNSNKVTVPWGYYSSTVSYSVPVRDINGPAVSFNSATGIFTATASITNPGYYGDQTAPRELSLTIQSAQTINTSTADQTIASYRWLTGAQTIKSVTTENIFASNIKSGVTVKVGDANNASRITQVTGTLVEGVDAPTFTVIWDDNWSAPISATCDKTYAECKNYCENGYTLFSSIIETDQSHSESQYLTAVCRGVSYGATDEFIKYSCYGGSSAPNYDLLMYPNGMITITYPSAYKTTLNIAENGTITNYDYFYDTINVNVPGGDAPVFETVWSSDYSSTTTTCNKTFAECLTYINNGGGGALEYETVLGDSWVQKYGLSVKNYSSQSITFVRLINSRPDADIVYSSNGNISFVQPSAYLVDETITQNGYYPGPSNGGVFGAITVGVSNKYTATIRSGSTGNVNNCYVRLNSSTKYYTAGDTFEFSEGDLLYCYGSPAYSPSGNLDFIISVNAVTVASYTFSSAASYSYTMPAKDIEISMTYSAQGKISILESVVPLNYMAGTTVTPSSTTKTLTTSSKYLTSNITINGDANLVPSNIASGVSIFGVTGTHSGGGGGYTVDDIATRNITGAISGSTSFISSNAFYYLETITQASFPACTYISTNAFLHCIELTQANFSICTSIANYAFEYCFKLNQVSFPECTYINFSAFASCYSLTQVSFPACTTISGGAFQNCSALSQVSFPACTTIGASAFQNCSALTQVSFPACTTIGASAFQNCSTLTQVSFPACITISTNAFSNCSALSQVSFSECTTIGTSAFIRCRALTQVSFPACTYIYNNAFQNCSALTQVSFPACINIYNSAFTSCYSLTQVNFPECRSIGGSVFSNCSALTQAIFPKCSYIGPNAFFNCSTLTKVSFPVSTAAMGAFQNCTSLNTVIFNNTSTPGSLYSHLFSNCTRLLSLYLIGATVKLNSAFSITFESTPMYDYTVETGGIYGSIFVPSSFYTAYITSANWSEASSRFASLTDTQINNVLNYGRHDP